jgi:hypothetical protein
MKTLVARDSFRHLPSAVDMDRGTACNSMILIEPPSTGTHMREKELATTHRSPLVDHDQRAGTHEICIPQQESTAPYFPTLLAGRNRHLVRDSLDAALRGG